MKKRINLFLLFFSVKKLFRIVPITISFYFNNRHFVEIKPATVLRIDNELESESIVNIGEFLIFYKKNKKLIYKYGPGSRRRAEQLTK